MNFIRQAGFGEGRGSSRKMFRISKSVSSCWTDGRLPARSKLPGSRAFSSEVDLGLSSQSRKAGRGDRVRLSRSSICEVLFPLGEIDVIAAGNAGVELARTADLLL